MVGEHRGRPVRSAVPAPPARSTRAPARASSPTVVERPAGGGRRAGDGVAGLGPRGEFRRAGEGGGQPVADPGEFGGAAGRRGRREVPGRGEVDIVVEEVDGGQRPAVRRAVPRRRRRGRRSARPRGGGADALPVGFVTAGGGAGGEVGGVDDEELGGRGGPAAAGPAQHPQVQGDAVRAARRRRQRDDGAQRAAAQQVGADAAAGAAGGGGGRHEEDRGAAGPEPGEGVLHPGQFGFGTGREAVLPAGVVGEFVMAPVAFVERRVAQDGVGGEVREGIGARVSAARTRTWAPGLPRARRSAVSAARSGSASWPCSCRRAAADAVTGLLPAHGGQQARRSRRPGRGRCATGPPTRPVRPSARPARRSEGVLPGVGVQVRPSRKVYASGAPSAAARSPAARTSAADGASASRAGPRTGCSGPSRVARTASSTRGAHRSVRRRRRRCAAAARRRAAHGPATGRRRPRRVRRPCRPGARQLLPDPFTERDLGEFALVAQPLLDVGGARRRGWSRCRRRAWGSRRGGAASC